MAKLRPRFFYHTPYNYNYLYILFPFSLPGFYLIYLVPLYIKNIRY
jgi:hypothetical protein